MKISLRKPESPAHERNDNSPNRRKGFVIVEVIVAMVLLAVAVTSLAALLTSISRSGMVATGNAYRNGVLMNEVNRLEGLPFDSVRVGSSSVVVSALPYPHTRAIRVDSTATNIKVISVIITPSNGRYKSDTLSFFRTKAKTSKALCTTCAS